MFRQLTSVLIFLIFPVIYIATERDISYRYDYSYNNEAGGWFKYHQIPATFQEAFLRCKLEGALIASPLNKQLQKAMIDVQEVAGNNCVFFTGIHATISKGDFTSSEGVPLGRISLTWAPNEPDNFEDSEDCIIMLKNGSVADARCNETYPYICYRKKTSIPMNTVCGTVDHGYFFSFRTGSCYKFHTKAKTWKQAQMTCLAEGGYLAIINSLDEAQVLKELFATIKDASITSSKYKDHASLGFYNLGKKGTWITVNGQTLEEAGYEGWSGGQPDNAKGTEGGQNCGSMFRTGLFDDVWCDSDPFAFICEKAPDSLAEDFE